MMKKKRNVVAWRCFVSATALFTSMAALAGEQYADLTGGNCGAPTSPTPDSQAGLLGDAGKDNSDPIYLATGDFQHVQTDLVIPGRGLDFEITRFYRSRSGLYAHYSTMNWQTGSVPPHPETYVGNYARFGPRLDAPFGMNWDFSYNMRVDPKAIPHDPPGQLGESPVPDDGVHAIDQQPPTGIYVYTGAASSDYFTEITSHNPTTGNPAIFANDKYTWSLQYTFKEDPIYIIDENQVTYEFNAFLPYTSTTSTPALPYAGRLASITDRNGNQITFHYETVNYSTGGTDPEYDIERIQYAIDTLGHRIDFYYQDDSSAPLASFNKSGTAQLIWRIVDHAGRVVEYDYFDNDSTDFEFGGTSNHDPDDRRAKLKEVTLPSITSTTDFPLTYTSAGTSIDHARFPNGRTWQYDYAAELHGSYNFEDGMLTKITDPNGVVIIENEYELDQQYYRQSGRVVRQKYGDKVYNYIVTTTGGAIDSPNGNYDYYVWVNDRRGAVTRFKYATPAGAFPSGANRQLLEKAEYERLVTPPAGLDGADLQVWKAGTAWKYLDASGVVQPLVGPQPQNPKITQFTPDQYWNNTKITNPGLSYTEQRLKHTDFPPPNGFVDPRSSRAVTTRTINSPGSSPAISITEQWRYDFDFGGGGCGCGSSSFETAYKDGNGNVTRKTYDADGNMLKVFRGLPSANPNYFTAALDESAAADDAASLDVYTYNDWGQVLTHTHPKKWILDDHGIKVEHSRVDKYEYYNNPSDEANHGRLHRMIVDFGGKNLTTEYEYDLIGNIIKEIDPGLDVTKYLYNQMSELVRVQQFDHANKLFAERMFFYDANGNMVVEEELNLDGDQTIDSSNKWFTTVHVYDKLDYRTETSREKSTVTGVYTDYDTAINPVTGYATLQASSEADNASFITQRWTYDANRNLTKFEDGEAVSGAQASNIVTHAYDARDLRIETVQGAGGSSPLKTKFVYNEDGLLHTRTDDPDEVVQIQVTNYTYDGINRLISFLDPMGNEFIYEYDDNHNIKRVTACGPVGKDNHPSQSDASFTLARISRVYDPLDRFTDQFTEVFDYSSPASCDQLPSGSQQQTMSIVYNRDSSVHERSVPSGDDQLDNVTTYFYDTASRLDFMIDAAGNTTENEYDSDSNITKVTWFDFSSETPTTTQAFHVDYTYDALNRQVSMIDGVGNDTLYAYDSRSNLVEMKDARNNVTAFIYDALSRRTQVDRELSISELSTYDDSNRLVSETDDNGNTTQYEYDGLGRVVKVIMPDSTFYTVTYDANGNPAIYTDARGVVVSQTFDLNNRLAGRTINDSAVSGGIPGSTFENFTYDGLGRLLSAENDFTEVTREYDSRSNVLKEVQNADYANSFPVGSNRIVEYAFDLANNNAQITYPSGREIYRTHDELNRLTGIFNAYNAGTDTYSDPVTEFEYIGRRVESRNHGNDTRTAYSFNGYSGALVETGDKGFGRVNKITTTNTSSSTILDAFTFTWDENQNRTSYKDTSSGMKNRRHREFGYDSINRLVSTDVDFPDPNTDFTAPTNSGVTAYTLDGVHNRTAVSGFEGTGAPIGTYSQASTQADLNQYLLTPREAGSEWAYFYDANGNLVERVQNSPADYNGDYAVNGFDASAFNTAYNNGDPEADYNGDGQINFFDVSAFLQDYQQDENTDLEHWHYSYDFRNQLVGVTSGFGTATPTGTTNTYDALARRVLETSVGQTKQMVYGGVSHWEVLEQIDLSQTAEQLLTTHVYGIGIDDEVSYRIEDLQTPEDMWSHRDDLNSLTSITDENGDVKERYEYGDYGEVSIFDASGLLLVGGTQYYATHLFTGRSLIGGSGLYDLRHRVFDSQAGRFMQRDPVGTLDHINLYQYVFSNPHKLTDPFGLGQWVFYPGGPVMPGNYPELKRSPGFDRKKPYIVGKCNGYEIMYNIDVPNPYEKPRKLYDPDANKKWWQKPPFGPVDGTGLHKLGQQWNESVCAAVCRENYSGTAQSACRAACLAGATSDMVLVALTSQMTIPQIIEYFREID